MMPAELTRRLPGYDRAGPDGRRSQGGKTLLLPSKTQSLRGKTPPPQLLLLVAMASVQFGSAFADKTFDRAGPGGVAFLRVLLTAVVLLVITRPRIRGRSPRELKLVVVYGLTLATMNWTFYEGLDRLPLGVAVTIEFIGPLAVAVAGSRRLLDGLWVLLAAAGVVLLALRGQQQGVQVAGVVLVLIAAACWATYILLAKRVGQTSFSAPEALALGMAFGTFLVLPAGVVEGGSALLQPVVIVSCLGVAVLSSLIPYTLEMIALRRLSTAVFGLLMSVEPAVAAMAGVIVLGQSLTGVVTVGIAMVIAASVGTTITTRQAVLSEPEA
jgi:inner membrane transporter RhtA